ncbi:MAG: amino acid ABC transporter permease [Actinomycetes bacterium]|nr:amino acid ABC transporter permease [Actinomycetota bacterium]
MSGDSPNYQWHWNVLFSHDAYLLLSTGLKYTLLVAGVSLIFGNVLGLCVALVRISKRAPFSQIAYIYTDFFRTTPALVQLIWIFYVMPILLHISLSPVVSGIVALSLNSGAFLAEIFRAGIQSIGRGQRDASFVLGLSPVQSFRHVVLPQAFRRVLPPTGNVLISLIKDSSLLSVIAVSELTYQSQIFVTSTFRPLELYTALAVLYFLLTYPLSLLTSSLEKRFRIT